MVLKKWFIIIFAPPGNGKSLEQARLSYKLLKEYYKIEKKYPQLPRRFLFTNQLLSQEVPVIKKAIQDGHLKYWDKAEQIRYCPIQNCFKGTTLHPLHDCDLFCDEGATLFPATAKNADDDIPIWLKKMITQHRHRGLRLVFLTQDFMGINITARRCVWETWLMEKKFGSRDPSPSLPPIRFIWGIYQKRKIAPELIRRDSTDVQLLVKLDSEKKKDYQKIKLIGTPRWHWISKFKCSLYDTTQDVKELEIKRELEHIEVACNHPNCGHIHKTHKLK